MAVVDLKGGDFISGASENKLTPAPVWAEQPVTNEVVIAVTRAMLVSISAFVRCFVEPDIAYPVKQAVEGEVERLDALVQEKKGGNR